MPRILNAIVDPSLIPGPYPESLTPSGRYVYNECCDFESFESFESFAAAMLSRSGEPLTPIIVQEITLPAQEETRCHL